MRTENITQRVPAKPAFIPTKAGVLRTWERVPKMTVLLIEQGRVRAGWEVWLN